MYHFFVDREVVDKNDWWCYPAYFLPWIAGVNEEPTATKYNEYCRYPCKGADPPRPMSEWEILHCPWYLESDKWAVTMSTVEKATLHVINRGMLPETYVMDSKFAPTEAEVDRCEAMERAMLGVAPIVDGSWARKPQKVATKELSKDGSIVSGKTSKGLNLVDHFRTCANLQFPLHSIIYGVSNITLPMQRSGSQECQ